jgi:hypothetical protein
LILQFKRPTFLHGARAAQWGYWRQPFYRFERTAHQHRVLTKLERRLGDAALVRYAAPAFWRRGELERAHHQRTVLRRSGFVSPVELGTHKVWTYVSAGLDGRANPSGRRLPFRTFDDLFERLGPVAAEARQAVVASRDPFEQHLDALGRAARDRAPTLRRRVEEWTYRLRAQRLDLTNLQVRQLADIASIVTLTSEIGALWCLAARPDVAGNSWAGGTPPV